MWRVGWLILWLASAAQAVGVPAFGAPAPDAAPPPTARPVSSQEAEPGTEDVPPKLAAARDRLIAQLEKAAAAGLIRLEGELPGQRTGSNGVPSPSGARATMRERGAPDVPPLARADLRQHGRRARAGAEEDQAPIQERETAEPEPVDLAETGSASERDPSLEPVCLSDALLSLDLPFLTWAADRPLIGEFDRPDRQAVRAQAARWIGEGRGHEAADLVGVMAADAHWAPGLIAIARIVEAAPLSEGHALDVPGCEGHHALWQAMAEAQAGNAADALALAATGKAAVQSLAPKVLERMGTVLASAAAEMEEWETARRWLAFGRRGATPGTPPKSERLLTEARLAEADGRADAALETYVALRAEGGEVGRHATVRLAEAIADGRAPVASGTHNLRLDLGAIAFLEAGTPLGERALAAEARLGAAAYGREGALEVLAEGRAAGLIGATMYREAVAALSAGDWSDGPPLALLVEQSPERFADALAEPQFRASLARSYARLGLPDQGEARLRTGDLADATLTEDLAAAYLAADRPEDAARLAKLLPEGAARSSIEAGATSDPVEALNLLGSVDDADPDMIARLAWAAGQWDVAASALRAGEPTDAGRRARLEVAERRAEGRGAEPPPRTAGPPAQADIGRLLADTDRDLEDIRRTLEDG